MKAAPTGTARWWGRTSAASRSSSSAPRSASRKVSGSIDLKGDKVGPAAQREPYSHDFLDANMAMHEVFTEALGHSVDADVAADAELWNAAWALAKGARFFTNL